MENEKPVISVPIENEKVFHATNIINGRILWFQYKHNSLYIYYSAPENLGQGMGFGQAYDIINDISATEAIINVLNNLGIKFKLD